MPNQNATALPQLDLSKSVPLNQATPDQTALPQLDLSKSVPLSASTTAPTTNSTLSNVGTGLGEAARDAYGAVAGIAPPTNTNAASTVGGKVLGMAEDVATGINNLTGITTVVDSVKNAAHMFDAYEQARSNGASVTQALAAANERAKQADAITPLILQRGTEWKKNPTAETVRALGDAVASAAALYGLHKVPTGAVPAETATPAAEPTVGSPSWLQRMNPFRTADTAGATSKIEPAVVARTAKAGLAPGEVGLTDAAAAQKTAQAALDAKTATQTNIDQTLQSIAARHATENGLPAPTPGTASRDIITNNGNALVDAGKADYKVLDKFTDGKFTNAQQELKNAQLELQQKVGTTDADTDALQANVTRAQWNVDRLFDKAVENGMPKDTADAARTKFRTGQATIDAGNAVRMANKARGAAGLRTTDLNALENRWTALYDSGRLQQAFGDTGAKDALTQLHAARETGEIFEALPPTESQALRDLIAKNTTTGKFGTTTNWGQVQSDFSQMPDRAARFSDIPKVEKYINDQKFYQRLRQVVAGGASAAALGYAGRTGWNLVNE